MPDKLPNSIARVKSVLPLPYLVLLISIAMMASLALCSCQLPTAAPEEPAPAGYTNITPAEASEMLGQPGVVLLDVRTQEEYDSGHIAEALLIPLPELESRLDELNPDDHILVYCGSDKYSYSVTASEILVAHDFSHVYNIPGGILQWQDEGFPVTPEEPAPAGYTDITPAEVNEMLGQPGVVLLDVRTQREYDSGHIAEALLMPLSELESRLDELNPDGHILVYGRSGMRSVTASEILVAHDFSHVYNIPGGILQWQDEGFPVTWEKPGPASYTDVTPTEASEMLAQPGVVLLDVRTQEEYDSGHIAEAILMPVSELESRLDELNPDDHIVVYCSSDQCNGSVAASNILVAHDFSHVYNIRGGIFQWEDEGFPVTPEEEDCGCG